MLAVDDGLVQGNFDLSDMLMLAAFIVFVVAIVVAALITPKSVVTALVAAGLALVALAFFVA